jgi:spore germination cell wall hydrolase CwlJ-like protein
MIEREHIFPAIRLPSLHLPSLRREHWITSAILRMPLLGAAMVEREHIWPAVRLPSLRLPSLRREHWAASFILSTVIGLYLLAGINLVGISDGLAIARAPADLVAAVGKQAPAPEPLKFVKIAPQDAVALNASIPLADLPNPAARPFKLSAASSVDRARALHCLTQAVYYEAAIEPIEGQRAVAQVVLNRVRHPAYPKSVCGVVYQGSERRTGCQFTFTCDGSLARRPSAGLWQTARQVAEAALDGYVHKPVGWSTHYHTNWVVPYWSSSLVKAAIVGTHIFYRWTGGWGTGPAFTGRYAGVEPDTSAIRLAANTTDAAAAAAAALAKLTPEELAAAERLPDGTVGPASSVDSFQRAVLRRYEAMPGSAVTALLASQAKEGDKSMRWALTGEAAKEAPLGSKNSPAVRTTPSRASPPRAAAAAAPAAKADADAGGPAVATTPAAATSGSD